MGFTDLYLRAKEKLREADLWLHPAGAEQTGDPLAQSGTVVTAASLNDVETLADTGTLATTAVLEATETIVGGEEAPPRGGGWGRWIPAEIPPPDPVPPDIHDEGTVRVRAYLSAEESVFVPDEDVELLLLLA